MSSAPLLTGPTDIPSNPTHALICLHGFGDTGDGWLPILQIIRSSLPSPLKENLALFAPTAPTPTLFGEGRQWFRDNNWTFRDPPGLAAAATRVEEFLTQAITKHHSIPAQNTVLMGFSQGAMTTLYTIPRLHKPLAGHVAIAGLFTEPLEPTTITPTPTLILHGEADDIVPADASIAATKIYQGWNIPTETHIIPNMPHGATPEALAHISAFLQTVWNQPTPTP